MLKENVLYTFHAELQGQDKWRESVITAVCLRHAVGVYQEVGGVPYGCRWRSPLTLTVAEQPLSLYCALN